MHRFPRAWDSLHRSTGGGFQAAQSASVATLSGASELLQIVLGDGGGEWGHWWRDCHAIHGGDDDEEDDGGGGDDDDDEEEDDDDDDDDDDAGGGGAGGAGGGAGGGGAGGADCDHGFDDERLINSKKHIIFTNCVELFSYVLFWSLDSMIKW